jgi:hypothetical protein
MLYAEFNRGQHLLPMKWDKAESMFRHLNRIAWGYQFIAERKMFQIEGPEYRCVLVKWVHDHNRWEKRREVLLETSDPTQMEVVLFMLINEAEVNKC